MTAEAVRLVLHEKVRCEKDGSMTRIVHECPYRIHRYQAQQHDQQLLEVALTFGVLKTIHSLDDVFRNLPGVVLANRETLDRVTLRQHHLLANDRDHSGFLLLQ